MEEMIQLVEKKLISLESLKRHFLWILTSSFEHSNGQLMKIHQRPPAIADHFALPSRWPLQIILMHLNWERTRSKTAVHQHGSSILDVHFKVAPVSPQGKDA